jgi:flagellar export protein FliJ
MFKFRLEKVLKHRQREEEAAKRKYVERRAARVACEREIAALDFRRDELSRMSVSSVVMRIELEVHFAKADDDEVASRISLGVLLDEEKAAEREWMLAKRELQSIEKLREKSFAEWQLESGRRTQNELDEWAVLRSARLAAEEQGVGL